MALSDIKVKNAKPFEKPYKLSDEKGLYLLVNPNGAKYWRFKYRFDGKEKLLSLGIYDDVSLAKARSKRDDARKLLADKIDPGLVKQTEKRTRQAVLANSFEIIGREWHNKFSPKWTPKHGQRILSCLVKDIFPWLGNRPISEITAPEILTTLRRIENRGAIETAHRIQQNCSQIFRYAIATGRAERDPAMDLKGAIPPAKKRHYATITAPHAIGELMRSIQDYHGSFITKCALQLAPLLFIRPGELRHLEWSEISIDNAEIRIPKEKMKARAPHIVPLSSQAVKIIKELHPLTGQYKYLFPSGRSSKRAMSENTINGALRRLGYTKEEITSHGFRSMASTILNEQGWNRDAIERQLAHAERNNIRAAYNYAEYLPERRKMMQHWANYLEKLTMNSSKVIELNIKLNKSA
jgi:integrase